MKILFVCLGNICRSATAEGVMLSMLAERGILSHYEVDSAGILSCHQGELPDSRMRAHALRRGYELVHRSRPVVANDFEYFDLILGMDDRNIDDLCRLAPTLDAKVKIRRMTDFCSCYVTDHVPDPYYSGSDAFEYVIDLLEDACNGLINECERAKT